MSTRELTSDEIKKLNSIRLFEKVDPDVFRWIVRRVEWEHRIGTDPQQLTDCGITRVKQDDQPS